MKEGQSLKINFFHRKGNKVALFWINKIKKHINKKFSQASFVNKNPDVLFVLGGDGTILEAARQYHHKSNPMIFGLNLGDVGFLASVRDHKNFMKNVDQFLTGKFSLSERIILNAKVLRNRKEIFSSEVLNEVVAQSILGMVNLEVMVGNTNIRKIRGSGVLVATATGSTAFNLSAHGPIVMPDIKCLIITEIMDHNVPTPSIVVKYNEEVAIRINGFRQKGVLSISKNKKKADVILVADGDKIFPLEKGDIIKIKSSDHLVKLVEVEPDYFFKSLKDKFSVR
ncbi:MAG: NAD(+)/NADH kinase [Candidatus Yanofskybacteria bacterium]|nr:NAD(+)/NADH kinase [Candidatus Yanofskybacteria bacterium]